MNKVMLLALAFPVALASCGGGAAVTPTPATHTQPASVNGTVSAYGSGTGVIELLADDTQAKSASNPALVSATLNANGSFTLPLPSPAAVTPYLGNGVAAVTPSVAGCTGSLTNSTPGTQAYSFSTLSANGVAVESVQASQSSSSLVIHGKLWIYETKANTLGGSFSCTVNSNNRAETVTVTANTALQAGWNVLALDVNGAVSGSTTTVTIALTGLDDAPSVWYTGDNLGGLAFKNGSGAAMKTGLSLLKTALQTR